MSESQGPNELHPRVLNKLTEVIVKPLSVIVENFWRTDKSQKRRACVIPIFKKRMERNPAVYKFDSDIKQGR